MINVYSLYQHVISVSYDGQDIPWVYGYDRMMIHTYSNIYLDALPDCQSLLRFQVTVRTITSPRDVCLPLPYLNIKSRG